MVPIATSAEKHASNVKTGAEEILHPPDYYDFEAD
jgi:hypothetical protein